MGYFSLPSSLNAIAAITSYYCVILKIVILDYGIKAIQNAVFLFFLNKKILFLFKKAKKRVLLKAPKNQVVYFEKTGSPQP